MGRLVMKDSNIFKGEKGFADDVEQQLVGGCMVPATATAMALIVLGFALNFYF